jgi:hypothetical protein
MDAIIKRDPGSGGILAGMTRPGGPLNQALVAAGISLTSGTTYFPALNDKFARHSGGVGPFIPMVMYTVTADQLEALRAGFPMDTKNALSSSLGQTENRGLRTSESYSAGTETLWRMAVYPIEGDPNHFRVGLYGEAVPEWSAGQAMPQVGELRIPLRAGGDTRVGQKGTPATAVLDGVIRAFGLETK